MALECVAWQSPAGRAQCPDRPAVGGREPVAGVGGAACHRCGSPSCVGLHLLGRGRHGHSDSLRFRSQHLLGVGAQHPRSEGSEPYAAAHARPHLAFGVARQGFPALGRCAQPSRIRCRQCGELSHRDHSEHPERARDVLRSLLLSLFHGQDTCLYHRRHHTGVRDAEQGLHLSDAPSDPQGAQFRLQGAERLAGNHSEPHAHQDAGKRLGHGRPT